MLNLGLTGMVRKWQWIDRWYLCFSFPYDILAERIRLSQRWDLITLKFYVSSVVPLPNRESISVYQKGVGRPEMFGLERTVQVSGSKSIQRVTFELNVSTFAKI